VKLTTVTNVSVDGVTQGHRRIDAGIRRGAGAPDEDGSVGFERFGWAPPLLDDEASTFIGRAFQRADAFLFGRRTYEIFADSWGAGMDPGNPVGEALKTRTKYGFRIVHRSPSWRHENGFLGPSRRAAEVYILSCWIDMQGDESSGDVAHALATIPRRMQKAPELRRVIPLCPIPIP
jgi:hypothetical protein